MNRAVDMTSLTWEEKIQINRERSWDGVALAWSKVPAGRPLPRTPEMLALVGELVIAMYGPALKELEKR